MSVWDGNLEYWIPGGTGLSAGFVAQVNPALNMPGSPWTPTNPVEIITDLTAPDGKAAQYDKRANVASDESAILRNWGAADWLCMAWVKWFTAASTGYFDASMVGGGNKDGFEFGFPSTASIAAGQSDLAGVIPGSANSFEEVDTTGAPFTRSASWHMILYWMTHADQTQHLRMDNGTEFTHVNADPAAAAEADGSFGLTGGSQTAGQSGGQGVPFLVGSVGVWQGTIPDATGRAQLWNSGAGLAYLATPSAPSGAAPFWRLLSLGGNRMSIS